MILLLKYQIKRIMKYEECELPATLFTQQFTWSDSTKLKIKIKIKI